MIYVISKSTFGDYGVRDIQCNANWDCCPYSDYALIPDNLVDGILATKGYCNITLNSAGTEVTAFSAKTIPSVPEECCGENTVLSVNGVKANSEGELTLTSDKILGDMNETTAALTDESMLVFKYSNPAAEKSAVFYKKAPLVATYVKKKIGESLTPSTVVICNSSGALTSSSNVDTGELGTLNGIDTSKSIQSQLNGKIGKFTLAWTNESPGSSFGKQNISVNYSNYTHLLYVFRGSTSGNGAFYDSTLVPASVQTNLHTMVEYLPGSRSVTPTNNTTLSFSEGYVLNGTTQQNNNNYIIPYRIYGCNLV